MTFFYKFPQITTGSLKCYYDEKMLFSFSLNSDFIFGKNAPCQLLQLDFKNKSDFLTTNFSSKLSTRFSSSRVSLLIQLSQCNSTGREPGNGGQFKREIHSKKKKDLFLKLSCHNWHGAFLANIKSESRENEKKFFSL